jgi:hypothetical protein
VVKRHSETLIPSQRRCASRSLNGDSNGDGHVSEIEYFEGACCENRQDNENRRVSANRENLQDRASMLPTLTFVQRHLRRRAGASFGAAFFACLPGRALGGTGWFGSGTSKAVTSTPMIGMLAPAGSRDERPQVSMPALRSPQG